MKLAIFATFGIATIAIASLAYSSTRNANNFPERATNSTSAPAINTSQGGAMPAINGELVNSTGNRIAKQGTQNPRGLVRLSRHASSADGNAIFEITILSTSPDEAATPHLLTLTGSSASPYVDANGATACNLTTSYLVRELAKVASNPITTIAGAWKCSAVTSGMPWSSVRVIEDINLIVEPFQAPSQSANK